MAAVARTGFWRSRAVNVATAALARFHWSTLLVVAFLGCWWTWAFVATRHATPGLLDDGSHIARAFRYVRDGFLPMLALNWARVLDATSDVRFYEVQYATLGFMAKSFGTELRYWYLAQLFFCALTAGAGYLAVRQLTRSRVAAAVCLIGILTVSPLADAALANFGKVEVVMSMAMVLAFAACTSLAILLQRPSSVVRNLAIVVLLVLAAILMAVAGVAKESGKLLALVPLGIPLMAWGWPHVAQLLQRSRPVWIRIASVFVEVGPQASAVRLLPSAVCIVAGLLMLSFSIYVFRERGESSYLAAYFSLNFDPRYLLDGFLFYATQAPDLIILAAALVPIAIFGFIGDGRKWSVLVTLIAVAALYLLLLFAFRYRAAYYAYPPGIMIAVAFAIGLTLAPRRYQIVLLGLFVLTRAYAIPYIYFQSASQRYVDYVSFRAMQAAADLGAPRVILLDVSEQDQLVQEWNLLREEFFEGRLPPAFGGPPDFKAWAYQQRIRDLGSRHPRRDTDGYMTGRLVPAGEITSEPNVGDLVAVRFGRTRFGAIAARAVLPLRFDETATLKAIDPLALAPVARVGGVVPGVTPCECGIGSLNLGWQFYRVVSVPRFLIMGREADGWMNKHVSVRVGVALAGQRLKMTIEVPGWMPRQYPVTVRASLNGETVSLLTVAKAGRHELSVPLDRAGSIDIDIDRCGDPKDAPANDPRAFCYWFAGAEAQ